MLKEFLMYLSQNKSCAFPCLSTSYRNCKFTDTDEGEVSPIDRLHSLQGFIYKIFYIIINLFGVLLFQLTYAIFAHIPMDQDLKIGQEVYWVINIKAHSY